MVPNTMYLITEHFFMTSPHQIHEKEPPLSTILLQSSQAEGSFGAQAKKKKGGILLFNYMKQAANQHN